MHGERRRLRSMLGNSCMLDANAVLRFLLKDIDEQFQQVRTIIRTKNVMWHLKYWQKVVMCWKESIRFQGRMSQEISVS